MNQEAGIRIKDSIATIIANNRNISNIDEFSGKGIVLDNAPNTQILNNYNITKNYHGVSIDNTQGYTLVSGDHQKIGYMHAIESLHLLWNSVLIAHQKTHQL